MTKTLNLFADLSPMNLSIDLYDIGTNIMTRQHEKHIKINSTKRNQQKDYKRKCYTNHIK